MPEYLIFLLPFAYFGYRGVQLWRTIARYHRLLRAWQETAGACGLQVMQTSLWGPMLMAQAGFVTVSIDGMLGSEGSRDTRTEVRVPGSPDFHKVSIRREPLVRRAGDIKSGDPHFDRTFLVEGPMRTVLALLDAETRRLLIQANAEGRLQISTDTLRVENMSEELVPDILPLLLRLGQRLTQPLDAVRRLAENANRDPEVGVRLQNLLLLIRELPEAPETVEALRTACSDPSPGVRLQAAKGLGAEGRDALLRLTESLEDDAVSAEAVSALAHELSFERTKAILDRASDRRFPKTSQACLEALGQKGASPGQLSVAEPEGGQLSMVSTEAGQVSLAVEPFPLPPEEPEPPSHRVREKPGPRP